MMKNKKYYAIGILFIICISLVFYNYKTIEPLSFTETNYKVIPSCDSSNTTTQNLPSYKLYFQNDSFKCLYASSNTKTDTNVEAIFKSLSIFGVDDCNDVLYSIATNNLIKSYNNGIIKFKIQKLERSDLLLSLTQLMKDAKINFNIFEKLKKIEFSLNGNSYVINTEQNITLSLSIDKLSDYSIVSITCNNYTIYNINNKNSKYFYGKIFYDNDPNNFYYCICKSYY